MAAAGEAAIALEGLRVERAGRTILHDINLTVPAGAITVLIGPSGAGKSTLLATLNGTLKPVEGQIHVGALGSLDRAETLHAHRRQTGTVLQEPGLIDRLTALDNVLLGLADRRHPLSLRPWSDTQRRDAAQALQRVGLLGRALTPAGQLSGGERQRVGIARALVRKPRLILGDEPFAAADPTLTRQLAGEFRGLVRREAITVFLVLHQIDLARRIADRIVGLRGGRIGFDGPAEQFDIAVEADLFSGDANIVPFPPAPRTHRAS